MKRFAKLETWKDSFKNYSQWVNVAIGALGASYLMITPEMRTDLPNVVVGIMAGAAFINIIIRNTNQPKKYVP